MNLISCDNCGTVLDKDKLKFAEDMYDYSGGIDKTKADYNQDYGDFMLFVNCPCCKAQVWDKPK